MAQESVLNVTVRVERPGLVAELRATLNKHSVENGSNTPDFILAQYLLSCLAAFETAVNAREKWYGRTTIPGAPLFGEPEPLNEPISRQARERDTDDE
jgi:hypothetical protein